MSDANRPPPLESFDAFAQWIDDAGSPEMHALYAAFVALAKDAERLDWLDEIHESSAYGGFVDYTLRFRAPEIPGDEDAFRRAIDAARAAKEK